MLTRDEKMRIGVAVKKIHNGNQEFSCNAIYYGGYQDPLREKYTEFIDGSRVLENRMPEIEAETLNFKLIRIMLLLLFLEVEG